MTRVVGFGAGGHAKVIIEILRLRDFEIVGLLDPKEALWGTEVIGVPVLCDDSMLTGVKSKGVAHAFIGVGSVGDSQHRIQLYDKIVAAGFEVVTAIHPAAVVSDSAVIGAGTTVMAG